MICADRFRLICLGSKSKSLTIRNICMTYINKFVKMTNNNIGSLGMCAVCPCLNWTLSHAFMQNETLESFRYQCEKQNWYVDMECKSELMWSINVDDIAPRCQYRQSIKIDSPSISSVLCTKATHTRMHRYTYIDTAQTQIISKFDHF